MRPFSNADKSPKTNERFASIGCVLVVFVQLPGASGLPRKAPINRSVCLDRVDTKNHTVCTGLPLKRGLRSGVERYLFSSLQSKPRTRSRTHFNSLSSSSPFDDSAIHSVPPNPSVIPSNRA